MPADALQLVSTKRNNKVFGLPLGFLLEEHAALLYLYCTTQPRDL